MGLWVAGFHVSLSEQGYSALAVRNMLKDVGAVGRWMQERDLQLGELTPAVIGEFRLDCMARGGRKIPSVKSFEPLFRFLRDEGVVGELPEPESAAGRLPQVACGGGGLAEATVIRYENLARRFLELHSVENSVQVGALTGAEVVAFLMRESDRISVGSAKGRVAELRSLLRFLFVRGLTPRLLCPPGTCSRYWTAVIAVIEFSLATTRS
jgi:site-specific recombinase XerD